MRPKPVQDSSWTVREEDFPRDGGLEAQGRFLLHYAHLAPSSHNTQPWLFRVEGDRVTLRADDRRWLRVADPEQRELFLSAGCALENLLVAAEHFGLGAECRYLPDESDPMVAASVTLRPEGTPSRFRPPELFDAIFARHTNHQPYEPRAIPPQELSRLRELCVEEALEARFTTLAQVRKRIDELVVRSDAILFADPRYRKELAHWIGQGVFGTSWFLSKMSKLAVRNVNMGRSQGRRDRELMASAPAVGFILSRVRSGEQEIKAGQAWERMALAAAHRGIWFQPMSQVLQVPQLRREIAGLIPEQSEHAPLIIFRAGFAEPEEWHTPRRKLDEVLLAG